MDSSVGKHLPTSGEALESTPVLKEKQNRIQQSGDNVNIYQQRNDYITTHLLGNHWLKSRSLRCYTMLPRRAGPGHMSEASLEGCKKCWQYIHLGVELER